MARVVWPRVAGVVVALAAQGTIYLGLRHMSSVSVPAWAHHRPHGMLPFPSVVGVDVVHGAATAPGLDRDTLPAPVLSPAPQVVLDPPDLGPVRQAFGR